MSFKRIAAPLLVALPLLLSCRSDDSLNPPPVSDPLFRRYAALGNSITAGFQSAGISDSTQQRAYPQLLAKAMGTTFNYPRLNGRGCPPPFTNNTTQTRVGAGTGSTCDLRIPVSGPLNSVAVPGNAVGTLLSNFGGLPSVFDPLKTIFLGGRTEVELMQQLKPTFVSLWIGNNDVLGAFISLTNAGDTSQITPVTQFTAQFDSVADVIAATGAKAVVVSVGNVTAIPFASSAAIYYCLKNGGCPTPPFPPQNALLAAIPTFTVNVNCAPIPPAGGGIPVLVPWPIALAKVDSATLGIPTSIDCSDSLSVISPQETAAMITAVTAYNTHIAAVAAANNWAYYDINPALSALRANGTIPAFPDVSLALVPPPTPRGPVTFGPIFSQDGVHPSSFTHRVVADSIAATINRFYGPSGTGDLVTPLPVPVCGGAVTCPSPI